MKIHLPEKETVSQGSQTGQCASVCVCVCVCVLHMQLYYNTAKLEGNMSLTCIIHEHSGDKARREGGKTGQHGRYW